MQEEGRGWESWGWCWVPSCEGRTQGLDPKLPNTWNLKLGGQVWLSEPFKEAAILQDSPG